MVSYPTQFQAWIDAGNVGDYSKFLSQNNLQDDAYNVGDEYNTNQNNTSQVLDIIEDVLSIGKNLTTKKDTTSNDVGNYSNVNGDKKTIPTSYYVIGGIIVLVVVIGAYYIIKKFFKSKTK